MGSVFENKVCAVTGGASGFGLGISERLLSLGAKAVWLLDFNEMNLAKAAEKLTAIAPDRVFSRRVDIAEEGAIEKAIDEIVSVSGRIDALFNNAGRPMTRPVNRITPKEFRDLIALNLTGVIMGTLKAIGVMEKQGSGWIVNAASVGGLIPAPYQCAYGATKAGVIEFTRCLAYEYAGTDIHFSQYSPVNVATNIFSAEYAEKLRRKGWTEEAIAAETERMKPPADAMPLEEALDLLFAGLEKREMDIPIGEVAEWGPRMFVNDRPSFDKIALDIRDRRKAYYDALADREARGLPTDDLHFPG